MTSELAEHGLARLEIAEHRIAEHVLAVARHRADRTAPLPTRRAEIHELLGLRHAELVEQHARGTARTSRSSRRCRSRASRSRRARNPACGRAGGRRSEMAVHARPHSSRSASIGSTRDARSEGRNAASAATPTTRTDDAGGVSGSDGLTPRAGRTARGRTPMRARARAAHATPTTRSACVSTARRRARQRAERDPHADLARAQLTT